MSKKSPQLLNSKDGYNLHAPFYDQKIKWLNSFEPGKIIRYFPEIKNKNILDVGAGTGRLAVQLAEQGGLVTALDVSAEMLKILVKKQPAIQTVVGDAENLPFDNNTFDMVLAAFLVVHLKDPKIFFDEAYRVLKPGGTLLVTNISQTDPPPLPAGQGQVIIESYYHSPNQIKNQLQQLAFEIKHEEIVKENNIWINQVLVCRK